MSSPADLKKLTFHEFLNLLFDMKQTGLLIKWDTFAVSSIGTVVVIETRDGLQSYVITDVNFNPLATVTLLNQTVTGTGVLIPVTILTFTPSADVLILPLTGFNCLGFGGGSWTINFLARFTDENGVTQAAGIGGYTTVANQFQAGALVPFRAKAGFQVTIEGDFTAAIGATVTFDVYSVLQRIFQ